MKLDVMTNVWNDLESSYKNFLKIEPECSRKEYLEVLTGCTKSGPNPTAIKAILTDEVRGYTSDDSERYQELSDMLTVIGNAVYNYKGKEIKNFDIFVADAFTDHKYQEEIKSASDKKLQEKLSKVSTTVSTEKKSLNYDLRDCMLIMNRKYTDPSILLSQGYVSDFVGETKSGNVLVVHDPDSFRYRWFSDEGSYTRFFMTYATCERPITEENLEMYAVIQFLMMSGNIKAPFGIAVGEMGKRGTKYVTVGKYKYTIESLLPSAETPISCTKGQIGVLKGHILKTRNQNNQVVYFLLE
jgi:hypothetical protein